ncbi:MAG: DNA-directed RNA polymerase subunit delta [Mycoplasma sp.]|nr:DNA-directed RNA polymerase subunit delta [Candidatus Hennigella equi]
MENKQIITLAYELAKTKYKNKPFTFEQLWNDLVKKARLDAQEQKIVGHVYTCMLQDHRFIFIGNHEWKVREFLKESEQAALSHALYDFKQEQEAEAKRLADLNDKAMLEQEAYYDEEDLEAMHKEYKEKLMHDVDEEDEDLPSDQESESEDEEEDAE